MLMIGNSPYGIGDDVSPGPNTPTLSVNTPRSVSTAVAPAPVVNQICEWRKDGRTEEQVVRVMRVQYPNMSDAEIVQAQAAANAVCPNGLPGTQTPGLAPEYAPEQIPETLPETAPPVAPEKIHFAWWLVPLIFGVGIGFGLGKRS